MQQSWLLIWVNTPKEISNVMARILTSGREEEESFSIYDPIGFRVIIMTQANSQVNTRVLELHQSLKSKDELLVCCLEQLLRK